MSDGKKPILIACEGSNNPVHRPLSGHGGVCTMCGFHVACRDDSTALPHNRFDLIAALDRGDFDLRDSA